MRISWQGWVLFLVGVFSASAWAAPECTSYRSTFLGRSVPYCIDRSTPTESRRSGEPVTYFMHGMGGDAATWSKGGFARALEILRVTDALPAITFVSFDTSVMSFFSDRGGKAQGSNAYESWLLVEFMPMMERKFGLCSRRECRALAGFSMGGFGALKTGLRHPDLFATVAVSVPALPPFDVYEPWDKWREYFNRHPVGSIRGRVLLTEVRQVFSTPQLASQNDPVWLVEQFADPSMFPALYFDYAGRDFFGFQEGSVRFEQALSRRGLRATSVYVPEGTHDMSRERAPEVIRFISSHILPQ